MLVAIRHGKTSFNNSGAEKLRGWLPIPLDAKGMEEACKTAEYLKSLNLLNGSKVIFTSDLPRAVQTAQEIASVLGLTVEPCEELRDWNVGDYAGADVKKTLDEIHGYIDNCTKKTPNGESYKQYYARTYPILKKLVESEDTHGIVTHNRTMTLLDALTKSKGKTPNKFDLKVRGPVGPGGILLVEPNWASVSLDGIGSRG